MNSSSASTGSQFDDLYIQVASRVKGIDELLDSFMGFLHRKTDFFVEVPPNRKSRSGFPKGVAESMLIKSFKKFPTRIPSEADMKVVEKPAVLTPRELSTKSGSTQSNALKPKAPAATVVPRLTEEGKQIPVGNGGFGDNYYWTQTLKDLSVFVDVPPGTKGRDVKCTITPTKLSLHVAGAGTSTGSSVDIDGEFEFAVRGDESMWTINTSQDSNTGAKYSQILLTLDKVQHTWWQHVIKGHPQIDTTKVDSSQNIGDYDEQTQASIRKLMFEQKQQRLGLMPSPSDPEIPVPIPSLIHTQGTATASSSQQQVIDVVGKSNSVSEGISLQDSLSKLKLPLGVEPSMIPPIPWQEEDSSDHSHSGCNNNGDSNQVLEELD